MCYDGDQTLFIKKELFHKIGGFDETMIIMEHYDIVKRATQRAKYKIFSKGAMVSARKYDTNSWLAVQKANYKIVQMYKKGASQLEIIEAYKKMLRYR
jgi:GT2 family glycosyltransferase